ncbi:50S ribosomal protein L21 [Candidatus Roizmanbacteria bacterium]|nr:50S ribosomal protein L21 [Candidatus Roizmanbacteria bacterium]
MAKIAVIKSGGKQYLVKEGETINVDKIEAEEKSKIEFDTLAVFEDDGKTVEVGTPLLTSKVSGELIKNLQGDKLRVARFKAKVRYRKVRGFRPQLSQIKIDKI